MPARPEETHRTNRQIRVPQVRLIGAEGEQVGVIGTDDAIKMAQDKGLDLVEVAPGASPPVCRLLDYGKFRYSKQKKDAEAKKKQHITQVKELRVRPGTDVNDLQRQMKKAQVFLEDGQRVKFTLRFRGREMAHQDLGRKKLTKLSAELEEFGWVEVTPRTEGRVMHLVMAPGQKKLKLPPGAPAGSSRPPSAAAGAAKPAAKPAAAKPAAAKPGPKAEAKPASPPAGQQANS
ncbi:MAG: translation initiation factor IF-3 [Candidatus Binatia bacterium]|nr:translation initiation factor IF-3 [Candidatus Binatia bacterium]